MPEPERRRSERTSAVETAGGSFFFSSAGGSPKPEAGRLGPECRNAGMPERRKAGAVTPEVRGKFGGQVGRRWFFFIGVGLPEAGGREAGAGVPEVREDFGGRVGRR